MGYSAKSNVGATTEASSALHSGNTGGGFMKKISDSTGGG